MCGARNSLRVYKDDERIFIPKFKPVATILLSYKRFKIKKFGKCAIWSLFSYPTTFDGDWLIQSTDMNLWKRIRINVALMGDNIKTWDISASKWNERFRMINLMQMWIGTNWLDGCYAMRLVTKQTLDYLNFQWIILYYIHGSIFLLWM